MSEHADFTAPTVWEHDKYGGRLVAAEREFKGSRFFEIRFWAGEHGDLATKMGVTMPLEAVPSLAQALMAYVAETTPSAPENGS